jgi:hypothetical protein
VVELTAAIAWETYRARFYHALGMGYGSFSKGSYCLLAGDSEEGRGGPRMRLPNTAHTSRPWRIHEIARDYRGQMAVLLKPNGLFGAAYMAAIKPFRYVIVYPELMRQIGREWRVPAIVPEVSPGLAFPANGNHNVPRRDVWGRSTRT